MAFDAHKNFAYGTIRTAPAPAVSGHELTLGEGMGALQPAPPFNAVIWPPGVMPTVLNAEVVRVTAISTDTLTVTRAQEGATSKAILTGYQFAAAITAKTLTDVEAAVGTAEAGTLAAVKVERERAEAGEKAAQEGAETAAASKVSAEETRAKAAEKKAREEAEAASDKAGAAATAQAAAEAASIPLTQKDKASGVATLDSETHLTAAQVPPSVANGNVVYKALAGEPGLLISGTITRSANGAALEAPVVWPDGATGVYKGTESTTVPGAIDSYTITHVEGETTHTYAQPKVTRNGEGAVTNRPAITYA